jgi:DNA-3-methyladenine glycosylase I
MRCQDAGVTNTWVTVGEDGRQRCWWPGTAVDYVAYHDDEWGRPVVDDCRLFEKICLEGFQSGLSWLTILRKRENFRAAFDGFDPERVARFGAADVERLLDDPGIVRHRRKIESTINNAGRALELIDEFGSLATYFWSREPAASERPTSGEAPIPATTEASAALARDLKRRGWSFVGPTTAYAFMQAMGLVNDHVEGCEWRDRCAAARRSFTPPI